MISYRTSDYEDFERIQTDREEGMALYERDRPRISFLYNVKTKQLDLTEGPGTIWDIDIEDLNDALNNDYENFDRSLDAFTNVEQTQVMPLLVVIGDTYAPMLAHKGMKPVVTAEEVDEWEIDYFIDFEFPK